MLYYPARVACGVMDNGPACEAGFEVKLKICPQKILLRLRWVIVSLWLLLLLAVPVFWVRSYWNCDIVRRWSQHVTCSGLAANWFAFGTFGDGCTGMAF